MYKRFIEKKALWRNGLPWWLRQLRICLQCRKPGFDSWMGKIPWRREWLPTLVFLPRESHGQRNPASYSPWGRKESDTTERLHLSGMVAENTHPFSEFLLLFPFSLPWRGTEKEELRQSIITLAFSAASSTSSFYHLFYNLRRLFTFRLFPSLNSISWVFYPTMNFSTPQWIFLQLSTQIFHATSNSMQDVFPA